MPIGAASPPQLIIEQRLLDPPSSISSPVFCLQTNIAVVSGTSQRDVPTFQAVHFVTPLYIRCPKMDEENELIALRREKLEKLRARGVEPFGAAFKISGDIAEVRAKFKEGDTLCAAGRITAHRDMGKSHFIDLRDATGRIQIYFHAKEIGAEAMEIFNLLDLGDLIGVEGLCFLTKTGEQTLKAKKLTVLAKSLRPLPEKWHGLQDVEARYRERYLDLISNEQSRENFGKRVTMVREIRRFLRTAVLWKSRRRFCKP